MCTASWSNSPGGYCFFFNRDEQRSRPRAIPPEAAVAKGVRCIAPKDPQAGGTWIAVNEYGLSVALLNNYEAAHLAREGAVFETRGNLPLSMMDCLNANEVGDRVSSLSLGVFNAFHLMALDPFGNVKIFSWNGTLLKNAVLGRQMITTSSFRSQEVQSYRERLFDSMVRGEGHTGEALEAFQKNVDHSDRAFNPLMTRDDGETHCLSMIEVGPDEVSFGFSDRTSDTSILRETSWTSMELV